MFISVPRSVFFRGCQPYNEASIPLAEWQSGRRVPLRDWLDVGVKVKSTAKADVDFCSKMASLTAVMQTNRPGSSSLSKKRTGMMTQRRFRLLDNNVLLFLSLASMLHCALADGKTLVLLDNLNIRDTHSIFFRSLAGQYGLRAFSSINTLLCAVIDSSCIAHRSLAGHIEPFGPELVDLTFMLHNKAANVICIMFAGSRQTSFKPLAV